MRVIEEVIYINENFDLWNVRYKPILNPFEKGVEGFETFGEQEDFVLNERRISPNKVWTLVETDYGDMLVPGYHLKRRKLHYVCEKEWTDPEETYLVIKRLC